MRAKLSNLIVLVSLRAQRGDLLEEIFICIYEIATLRSQ
jgi:hypothetical protein